MEVIGGLSSVLQVTDNVAKVAKRLNDIRERQCRPQHYPGRKPAVDNSSRLRSPLRTASKRPRSYRTLETTRQGPRHVPKLLCNLDQRYRWETGRLRLCAWIETKDQVRWLENILKEYTSNLEGQVQTLQLLLTIFHCRTATEKKQKLANEESRTI